MAAVCLQVQVYKVFAQLCPAMGLRLGLASGKMPLALEAEVLVDQSAEDEPCCAVDVLVATPGRLMSHLQGTPGMHLDGLKMLVCHRMPRELKTLYTAVVMPHVMPHNYIHRLWYYKIYILHTAMLNMHASQYTLVGLNESELRCHDFELHAMLHSTALLAMFDEAK